MTEREVEAKSGVIAQTLEGSLCLVDPETWNVAVLNETASDLWRLAAAGYSQQEIVQTLAGAYLTDPASITKDVQAALDELLAGGFLVVISAD